MIGFETDDVYLCRLPRLGARSHPGERFRCRSCVFHGYEFRMV